MKKSKQLKIKEYTIREFSYTAKMYDSSGKYENVKQSYLYVSEEVKKETFKRLLDCGCGTGAFLEFMVNTYPEGDYFGVDITPEMIHIANSRKMNNVSFLVGDCEIIDLPEKSFDVITCIHSFHHFPNPKLFLENMKRMLVEGGRIVISDNACTNAISYWLTNNILLPKNFYRLKLGDVHYYTKKDMWKFCKELGFYMEKYEVDGKNMYCVLRNNETKK